MLRRPQSSTLTDTLFPTRRSSALKVPRACCWAGFKAAFIPDAALVRSEKRLGRHTTGLARINVIAPGQRHVPQRYAPPILHSLLLLLCHECRHGPLGG